MISARSMIILHDRKISFGWVRVWPAERRATW
jgi:hypothetical protein